MDLFRYIPEDISNKKRIAIIGGSFNPPHMGHAHLANVIYMTTKVDQVWIIPVADHPFNKLNVSFEHRIEMCKLNYSFLGDLVYVSPLENFLPKPSYTVQTLRTLKSMTPNIKYTFVMGSDIIHELKDWQTPELIKYYANVLVYHRAGYPITSLPDYLAADVISHTSIVTLSSTEVRSKFDELTHYDGRLAADVLDYAREHNLYLSENN